MAMHAAAPRKNSDPIDLVGTYNHEQIQSLERSIEV